MSLLAKAGAIIVRGGSLVAAAGDCLLKCCTPPWVCAWNSASDDPVDGKSCYEKGTQVGSILSEHPSQTECDKHCVEQWVCAYASADPDKGRSCVEGPAGPDLIVLSEHDTETDCHDVCYDYGFGCVIDSTGNYECLERSAITDPGLILSFHDTFDECERYCGPELGACCVKDCDTCVRSGSCGPVSSYWKSSSGVCVEVQKTTSDTEEIWASDGCTVYKSYNVSADVTTCGPSNSDAITWIPIGRSKEGCESDNESSECYDGLTEEECRQKAAGKPREWSVRKSCTEVVCACVRWECKEYTDYQGDITHECWEVYDGTSGYETQQQCIEECKWSVCDYYYSGEYDCVPFDDTVHDPAGRIERRVCERVCCETCVLCHSLHQNLAGWDNIFTDCKSYSGTTSVPSVEAPGSGLFLLKSASGGWAPNSTPFAPCSSPFLSAPSREVRGVVDALGNFGYQITETPQAIDDCQGDGCDCNWADEAAVLEYARQGYSVGLWVDEYTNTTEKQVGLFLTGVEGGYTEMRAVRRKYRAFIYDCIDGWVDKTDELLKRSTLEYYWLTTNGPNAQDIPPEYVDPLQPTMECETPPPKVTTRSAAPPPPAGAGAALKGLLKRIGITASPTCKCNARAREMDRQGLQWCRDNVDTISGWLAEEAAKRGLPYSDMVGRALISLAIRIGARTPGALP